MQKIKRKFFLMIFLFWSCFLIFHPVSLAFAVDNSTGSLATQLEEESIWQKIKKDMRKIWESIFFHEEDYRVKIPIPPPAPPPIGPVKNSSSGNSTFWQWYQ